ncbi:MAG: DUF5698 domain-containing protein [Bacilli bacterium]|nr:DUF5698 domain-containing protein [Bacilli bacterium]
MLIYLIILILKISENAISTLRLIMVSNGKKLVGALLQFICAVIFIISTSLVIIDFNKDLYKIIFFSLGCFLGSYLGSFLEEKLALGTCLIICITDLNINEQLNKNNFGFTLINGKDISKNKYIYFIMTYRKKRKYLIKILKKLDKNAMLINESASLING